MHLIGLVSDGGVHSSLEPPRGADRAWRADAAASPDLVVHAFTDGRDTSPTGGDGFLAQVEDWCAEAGNARVGTRHRPLLRDGPRQALGPHRSRPTTCSSHGRAEHHADTGADGGARRLRARRDRRVHRAATTVGDEARIRPGDSVIAFNFRPDRMREITRALAEPASTRSIAAAPADRALRDADRVRGGLALPGRLPARRARDHAAARHRRSAAGASCTSPRPRSTRT